MNRNGEKNGYDTWAVCEGCGHEHWTGLIVTVFPPTREGTKWLCHSCVSKHDCSVEPLRSVEAISA